MCLAVPMEVVELRDDGSAVAELDGNRHDVDLSLVENVRLHEYVIVHAGFAIHKIDETAAMESLQLLRQAAAAASDLEDLPPE